MLEARRIIAPVLGVEQPAARERASTPICTGITDASWAVMVTTRRRTLLGSLAESALDRPMTAVEHTALDHALHHVVHAAANRPCGPSAARGGGEGGSSVPTLPTVVAALFNPDHDGGADPGSSVEQLLADGRHIGHALRRLVCGDLAGLFDGPSTVRFDPTLPMVSLDLSRIHGSDQLIAMVMTCASAWMEAALSDPGSGHRWVIYDEAWRLLRQPALLARMQAQWKLSRALGIANLMIVHRLSDLDAAGNADSQARALATGLLADCSTKIIYQQETSEAPHTAAILGLSVTEQAQLPDLQLGEGLWRVGQRAFVVRHQATDGELTLFDTNTRMAPQTAGTPTGEADHCR